MSENHAEYRSKAADSLQAAGYVSLASDLRGCGDTKRPGSVIYCHSCGWAKAITYTCHSRLCPECERRAQAQRLEKYLPLIEAATHRRKYGYRFKHVTISTNLSLSDDDIAGTSRDAWRIAKKALDKVLLDKLERLGLLTDDEKRRKRPDWKAQGIGAIAGGEFGEGGQKFHMHFFMYSPFLDKDTLTQELKRLTDSKWFVNDIRPKLEAADAKEVIAKYATKLTELPPKLLPKLQAAIAGQRRIRNYGCWFGVPDDDERPCGCPECADKLTHEAIHSVVEWEAIMQHGVDAWYAWQHPPFLLDLKHGNKSGEIRRKPPDRPWIHLL